MPELSGKVALVTGSARGIGAAIAKRLARDGAAVMVNYSRSAEAADEVAAAIRKQGGKAAVARADVGNPAEARGLVDRTLKEFGRLDIVVNNAAFQQSQKQPEDVSFEQWDHTFRTNIDAYFFVVKAALPHLKRGASIINSGSIAGIRGSERLLDYSATKGAILAFTRSLSKQLVERGIRVNCVAPGPVWTPLNPADLPAEEAARFGEKTPMGRPAQPEEIAPAYVYFASTADSSFVTGEVLVITGGETSGG